MAEYASIPVRADQWSLMEAEYNARWSQLAYLDGPGYTMWDRMEAKWDLQRNFLSRSSSHGVMNSTKEISTQPVEPHFTSSMAEPFREIKQHTAKISQEIMQYTRILDLLQEEIVVSEALPTTNAFSASMGLIEENLVTEESARVESSTTVLWVPKKLLPSTEEIDPPVVGSEVVVSPRIALPWRRVRFRFPPQITFSVFNCHVFDEMALRNRVRQTDIPHQFRNVMIRLGVFNTPDKLPPPEPPDCVFVSSSLPVLLLTAPPVNLYTIKEKGVSYDLTQLQSLGNFLSILQHGRSSIFMNDKQVLLRFDNKISDHRDIADINEYPLNLYCKIGDVETAQQVIVEMLKMIGCVYNSHWEKYIAGDKLEAKDILSYDYLKLLRLVINCGYEFNCLLDTPSRLPLLEPPDLIYCAMAIPLPPPKPPDKRGCAVAPAAAPKLPIEFSFISCIWGIEEYCIMKGIDKVLMREYNYIEALILGLHLLSGYACSIGIIVPTINSVLISSTNALILCGRLSCNDVVVWSSLIDGWSTFDHCWMAQVDISLSMLKSALLPQLTFYSQKLILECIGLDKNQVPELENDQQLKVSLRLFDSNETPSISQANLHVLPKLDILKVCYNNSKIPFNSNLMTILWKASNYDDNIAAHVYFLTLIMAELFGLFSKEFMEVKSLLSVDWEQIVVEMLDKLEANLILLIDTTVENKLQNGVSSCIGRLAHKGIQRWVLIGDTMEIVLTIGFACSLLFQGRQLIINCFNTPETKSFEASDVKSAIGLVHHMQTRLLLLGIFKSFAIIGTKCIDMGFGSADCAIFSLRAFFSLSFGSAQQWDPGGQFDMSTTTRTYQFKQWDPGKFVQQQLAPTLRTRLFLMGRVMS